MAEYYDIRVKLIDVQPELWRRIQIKRTATFQDLHEAIQDSCSWENRHLFSFLSGAPYQSPEIAKLSADGDVPAARNLKLKDYFANQNNCTYLYDFGDDWVHEISCETITLGDRFKRRLVGGCGSFPPEDCGGIYGFERCLDVLEGKEEDTDNLKEWLGDWRPNNFSLDDLKIVFDQ